jgi:glycine cleavage system H protein
MSNLAPDLFYTNEDEWLRLEGEEAVVGISDYAQDALSDIVYLEVPEVGATFVQGDVFGVIESVKAAADLYTPVGGEITAVNLDLISDPEKLNTTPYEAWLVRIKMSDPAQVKNLMDAAAYAAYRNISQ